MRSVCIDKLLKNSVKIPIELDFTVMTTCVPSLQCINKFSHIGKILCYPMAVVLKLIGSWATFVFQKPFAGHRINNLNKNYLK